MKPKYSFTIFAQCRECGAAYGWDKIIPHEPGCQLDRGTGVLALNCEWPDDRARREALIEEANVIRFHAHMLRYSLQPGDDEVTRDRKFARIRTADYLEDQIRMQIDDSMTFEKENDMPIYKVNFQGKTRLVKAATVAGARNHVLAPLVPEITMMGAEEVADAMTGGAQVEVAGAPVETPAGDATETEGGK